MSHARTVVEILNLSLEKIAEVKNLYPIDKAGNVLRYSKELSDYGRCTFRISTKDPLLTVFGDILVPHKYQVRIKRGGTTVWSGAIVDNTDRNRNYIEILALEYDFYFDKVLIHRDANTVAGDGKDNYRTFKTGTMAAAVTTLVTDAKTDFGSAHPLGNLVISSTNITNPNYPSNFVDSAGVALTGGWTFSDFIQLQFDYHSVYYVLKAFGIYASADFEIDENLNFYFKPFIGNKSTGIVFRYGSQGNIVDYNFPRLGKRMVNDMTGIAANSSGDILHSSQSDATSRQNYGLLQDAKAFTDVKDSNMLKSRLNEELLLVKDPENSPVNVLLNEKSYPLGQYNIGDIVTVSVKDHIISFEAPRRIVGITVTVHNTGRELTAVQTNRPKDSDLGN